MSLAEQNVFPITHRDRDVKVIKTLHVINGEHFSGAERVQQLLGNRLGDFGVSSEFACLKPGKFAECSGLPRERVHQINMRGRLDWNAVQRLCDLASEREVDLLHAHTPRSALLTAITARRRSLPWVYHVHSPAARDSTRQIINWINHYVERVCRSSCNRLITVSKSLRRDCLKNGVPRQKLIAIGNGVAALPPIDPTARWDRQSWRLGMIALFRPRKGIETLLHALARLGGQQQNVTLDIIGGFESEDYRQKTLRLIRELNLENRIHFVGFTNDVPSALAELDAMVLPSLFGEGMPMVVLEALACGVPVIATRVEGTPEVVRDGVEGLLAEPNDVASLSAAISRFVASRNDWQRMSIAALDRHRAKFSDVQMAKKIAQTYRQLLDSLAADQA